jgi:circadian clock protein KaiC
MRSVAKSVVWLTIFTTVEVEHSFDTMEFSRYAISFLTDDILRLHYVEIDQQLRKVLVIVKMRGGNHSKDIREYVITDRGLVLIGPHQSKYIRLTTGLPERIGRRKEEAPEPKSHK